MRNKQLIKRVLALVLVLTLVMALSAIVFAAGTEKVQDAAGGVKTADKAIRNIAKTGTYFIVSLVGLAFGWKIFQTLFEYSKGGGGNGKGVSLWQLGKDILVVIICLAAIFIAYNWGNIETKVNGAGSTLIDTATNSINEIKAE